MDSVEALGRRLDAVRGIRTAARSKWAHDYWTLVEAQLLRRLKYIIN